MADLTASQRSALDFFQGAAPLQGGVTAFAGDDTAFAGLRPDKPFSPFAGPDMLRARDVVADFLAAFQGADDPEAGLAEVVALARRVAAEESLALAQHALGIFTAHAGKLSRTATPFVVPPLAFRAPDAPAVVPFDADQEEPGDGSPTPAAAPSEEDLHYWREDMFLNEHHLHWHIVYPWTGVRLPDGTVLTKKRQGEVFVYMHQQMLARYALERSAAGLGPVEPLHDFGGDLGAGYDPNARDPKNLGYSPRPAGQRIASADRTALDHRRTMFRDALATSTVLGGAVPLDQDLVGSILESNVRMFERGVQFPDDVNEFFANLNFHNSGHGAIAATPSPAARVMSHPHTSLKDPVFWRWHREIDDLAQEYAAALPPYDPADPMLWVDDSDVAIVSERQLRGRGFDLDAAARDEAFVELVGADYDSFVAGLDALELRTGMLRQRFEYDRYVVDPATGQPNGNTVHLAFDRDHLFGERFVWVARCANRTAEAIAATLRIFICADAVLDLDGNHPERAPAEHRHWIEMERAPVRLAPGANILHRFVDESSIVRKLDGRAPFPTSATTLDAFRERTASGQPERDYCDCGWPLNLMLPRGTAQGMAMRMMVMVTRGQPESGGGKCGSRAYCGTDFDAYPELDDVSLGYPFDRPAPLGTLAMIANAPNMAMRPFVIRHDPRLAAELGLA
ncbi:MAG TPA: tyrosinase family protein [Allosphingosinicella sp.]|jgi:hypothetical protein